MGSKSGKPAGRLGDIDTGHPGSPPTPVITASGNVIINGKGAARKGDMLAPHHPGVRLIKEGSSSVLINGRPAARVSDAINCGGKLIVGSGNVIIGDKPKPIKPKPVNLPSIQFPNQQGRIPVEDKNAVQKTPTMGGSATVTYTPEPATNNNTDVRIIPTASDALSLNKENAIEYWQQAERNADNFPAALGSRLMRLNAEAGYSIAEGAKATYETLTDWEKFQAAAAGLADTVTNPKETFNALKSAAEEFADLPMEQKGEAAFKMLVGSLAGGGGALKGTSMLGKMGKTTQPKMPEGLHNQDWDHVDADISKFKTVRQVDMENLSDAEANAFDLLKDQGRTTDDIKQLLSSGDHFRTKELNPGDKLYGLDSSNNKWGGKNPKSMYWMDEASYQEVKTRFYKNDTWDKEGAKNYLALPCSNSADVIDIATVQKKHTVIESTVGKAAEQLGYTKGDYSTGLMGKIMPGGGTQITPDAKAISGVTRLKGTP
jgi:uncharacterized Zn-binding protein involved in type VI secretion